MGIFGKFSRYCDLGSYRDARVPTITDRIEEEGSAFSGACRHEMGGLLSTDESIQDPFWPRYGVWAGGLHWQLRGYGATGKLVTRKSFGGGASDSFFSWCLG